MNKKPGKNKSGISRRDSFKLSGLALGGLALGGMTGKIYGQSGGSDPTQQFTDFSSLTPFTPPETLAADQMRIWFFGTSCIPRLTQECNSIFVEVGQGSNGLPLDQFVFDCGSGVVAKYNAAKIPNARMNKVFLTHLHGDHISDLCHLYCFGPSTDRKSPFYIWGPGPSGVINPMPPPVYYNDGTAAFCANFREAMRWHTESFGFENTRYSGYKPPTRQSWGLPVNPIPVGNDDPRDGYAVVPIELPAPISTAPNIAYNNASTGVKITYFPAIHTRKGSVSYKLEWNGLSMIFSGDTKPNYDMMAQASNLGRGVDVLIHEMVMPASVWAMKNLGITDPSQVAPDIWNAALNNATAVQNSSHTPQGAFGYLLSQISPYPRLTVATHFQAEDDTVSSAKSSVNAHFPPTNVYPGNIVWAADFMVLNVSKTGIQVRQAAVSGYAFYPFPTLYGGLMPPKYHNADGSGNAFAQIDTTRAIPATDPNTGAVNYRSDGF